MNCNFRVCEAMSISINEGIEQNSNVFVHGKNVGVKGSAYTIIKALSETFGADLVEFGYSAC